MKEKNEKWGLQYPLTEEVSLSEISKPYDYEVYIFCVDFGNGEEMEYNEALDYVTDILTPENDDFSEEAIDALLEINEEEDLVSWVQEHVCAEAKLKAYKTIYHQYEGKIFPSEEEALGFIKANEDSLAPDTYPVPI